MNIRVRLILALLVLLSVHSISLGEETLHTFTSPDGRTLKAAIKAYKSGNGKILIELENGRTRWVPPTVFSKADQEYIRQWIKADQFMSSMKFKIKANSTKDKNTKYDTVRNSPIKSLETTDVVYTVTLQNRTGFAFEDIHIEYRAFIDRRGLEGREDQSRVEGGRLRISGMGGEEKKSKRINEITLETRYVTRALFTNTRSGYSTYGAVKTHEDYLKGFWIRVYGPSVDGQRAVREWCYPSDTMDHYEWPDTL